jgi:hypothetical protein
MIHPTTHGRAHAHTASPRPHADADDARSLYPFFLIVAYLVGVTLLIAAATRTWAPEPMMRHFMAGFFLVFSFFKLLDVRGFVRAYRMYDLLAGAVPLWAWAYPFVEVALGAAYALNVRPAVVNTVTLGLMLFGAFGVLSALRGGRRIRCACLGTVLNLPMTTVTALEDLGMAAMAGAMLVVG